MILIEELGPVVIEIWGVENGKLVVPVNSTLVRYMAFLAADTQSCVLILIEIGPVVIEIWGIENGELAVPVNNTLVHHMAFLAADTWSCVLINYKRTTS